MSDSSVSVSTRQRWRRCEEARPPLQKQPRRFLGVLTAILPRSQSFGRDLAKTTRISANVAFQLIYVKYTRTLHACTYMY